MLLVEVEDQWKPFFMGKAVDDLGDFRALQAIWSLNGAYPWDAEWPEALKERQFVLNASTP
jgi:hypothetical protein